MALPGTSMSGSTTITILGRMLAVMAAKGAARASPAKRCFIAMTMRKATPPEDGTATLDSVGNCSRMRLRKLAFVKRAASGCGSRSAAAGAVNRPLW
jgi:hypothetical protein